MPVLPKEDLQNTFSLQLDNLRTAKVMTFYIRNLLDRERASNFW